METSPGTSTEISILFVEDDPIARKIFNLIIPRRFPGVKLLAAKDGRVGLELFVQHRPEIVITDINMPVMDGIQIAREIREMAPAAIIIGVTAHCDPDYLRKAGEAGIQRHVSKPVDHKKLYAEIERCSAEVMLRRELRPQKRSIH